MADYEKQLAKTALDISAVKLNLNDHFQWASGYRMPIYNDNRILLGSFENRKLSSEALMHSIDTKYIMSDLVAGIPTAGIAPAAGLASLLNSSTIMLEDGKALCFDENVRDYILWTTTSLSKQGYDMIASTSPYGIVPGVTLANKMKLPFIYVRPKKKGHGMGKQIEGISPKGKNVFLVDYHMGSSYADSASEAILKEGGNLKGVTSEDVSDIVRPISLKGKSIIVVEDVISTGNSCVKEIEEYRKLGAEVKHCLTLYGYGMEKALDLFKDTGVDLHAAYSYDAVVKEAEKTGYISDAETKLLKEWKKDPFGWGKKHGFDRVLKE